MRKYRDIRKKSGLQMGDMIDLQVEISDQKLGKLLEKLFEERKEELQVKSVKVVNTVDNPKGTFKIEDMEVKLSF